MRYNDGYLEYFLFDADEDTPDTMGSLKENECLENQLIVKKQPVRRYYAVIKIGDRSPTKTTNFIPDLNSIDKRCKHPDVFVPTGTSEDYGTSIHVLKQCPNEN
jgi:hypothetical protein